MLNSKKYNIYCLILLFLLASTSVGAQDIFKTFDDTAMVIREANATTAPNVSAKKWNQIKNKFFTMNIGLAVLLDHNILSQDNNSIQQVGKVDPGTEFRGDRIIITGSFFLKNKTPWRYMVSANFNGLDAPEGKKSLELIDWNIDIPISSKAGWFTIGKQKEGVGLEYVSPGTQLMFTERSTGTPMFVRQRNIGIRYSNVVLKQRMQYTLGYFNNYWETGKSFENNGSQIVARVTGLPIYQSDRNLLHIGMGYRYTDATDGKLTYKAKPEANTAPSYISTGSFNAKGANSFTLEGIFVKGPISFLGEYIATSVNSASSGNPNFNTIQLGGSWFITGENRRYNKTTGNLGKLIPKKNFKFRQGSGYGAFELGARYTHTNGTDALINGGQFNRFTTALSWYPNIHFRYEFNFGIGNLESKGITGKTNFYQFRIQFEL
ncbi:MAG: porin [Sphingobacteriia bacterium]